METPGMDTMTKKEALAKLVEVKNECEGLRAELGNLTFLEEDDADTTHVYHVMEPEPESEELVAKEVMVTLPMKVPALKKVNDQMAHDMLRIKALEKEVAEQKEVIAELREQDDDMKHHATKMREQMAAHNHTNYVWEVVGRRRTEPQPYSQAWIVGAEAGGAGMADL